MFRKYEAIQEFYNADTGRIHAIKKSINLFDVKDYEEHVSIHFTDNVNRVCISRMNMEDITFRMSYEEFDKVMTTFLEEVGFMDPRSCKKKQYTGPVDWYFYHNFENPKDVRPTSTVVSCYPKGYRAKDTAHAMHDVLFTNIIPNN